jgi:hypothetical protein
MRCSDDHTQITQLFLVESWRGSAEKKATPGIINSQILLPYRILSYSLLGLPSNWTLLVVGSGYETCFYLSWPLILTERELLWSSSVMPRPVGLRFRWPHASENNRRTCWCLVNIDWVKTLGFAASEKNNMPPNPKGKTTTLKPSLENKSR